MNLETTLDALAPRLLRFCLGLAGDRSLAEEAAQDALTALVQRWRRHGPPEVADAFAFAVARRRLERRRGRRRTRAQHTASIEQVAESASDAPSPESRASTHQALHATLSALAQLKARDREALLLVAAGELDTAQAAQLLGIGTSALKMRVFRARQRLRSLLETSP